MYSLSLLLGQAINVEIPGLEIVIEPVDVAEMGRMFVLQPLNEILPSEIVMVIEGNVWKVAVKVPSKVTVPVEEPDWDVPITVLFLRKTKTPLLKVKLVMDWRMVMYCLSKS